MVSLIPVARPYEPTAPPKPSKPVLRRPTLSGTIRKSDDADLSEDLLSTPTKRSRVTFNPTVEEKVMEEYSVQGRSVEVIRAEIRRAIESHKRGDSADYDAIKDVFAPKEDVKPGADEEEDEEAAALAKVDLKTYLVVLTNHVSLLKGCSGLVRAVLACEWVGRDTGFVKVYIQFLGHLASAQGGFVGMVLDMLAGHFHGGELFIFVRRSLV
jgi:RNA polymerase I-specific transcription initiation factor RRN3